MHPHNCMCSTYRLTHNTVVNVAAESPDHVIVTVLIGTVTPVRVTTIKILWCAERAQASLGPSLPLCSR